MLLKLSDVGVPTRYFSNMQQTGIIFPPYSHDMKLDSRHELTVDDLCTSTGRNTTTMGSVGIDSTQCPFRADECKFFACRITLVCPCVGVHRKILPASSSLFLQKCPASLARLTWMVCEMKSRCPYSCCFVVIASRICSI